MCPARNQHCHLCGRIGHFRAACFSRTGRGGRDRQRQVFEVENKLRDSVSGTSVSRAGNRHSPEYFLGTVHSVRHENRETDIETVIETVREGQCDCSETVRDLSHGDDGLCDAVRYKTDDVVDPVSNNGNQVDSECNDGVDPSVNSIGSESAGWRTTLMVNGTQVAFKIDTGADVSVISEQTYRSLRVKPKLRSSTIKLTTPGGNLPYVGQFIARSEVGEMMCHHRIFVVKNITNNLLNGSTASRLGLVMRLSDQKKGDDDKLHTSNHSDEGVYEVKEGYGEVQCKPVRIKLVEGAEPYSVQTPRRIPVHIMPKVEEELNRLEKNGIIGKITEPILSGAARWCQ